MKKLLALALSLPFAGCVNDTGVAGIHEGGTAYRMDDMPLQLRPPLEAGRSVVAVLADLLAAVRSRRPGAAR